MKIRASAHLPMNTFPETWRGHCRGFCADDMDGGRKIRPRHISFQFYTGATRQYAYARDEKVSPSGAPFGNRGPT